MSRTTYVSFKSPLHFLCALATCTSACFPLLTNSAPYRVPACTPTVGAVTRWPYRVDSLLALPPPAMAIALVAPMKLSRHSRKTVDARFLPHDNLAVLPTRARQRTRIILLPPYVTPPGLARSPDASTVWVVVDAALLLLDPSSGHVRARWRLDIQALGWPAAVAAATGGRVYVAGQRYGAGLQTAMIEALKVTGSGASHIIWRSRLGITHAGIWLGIANHEQLVAYAPDVHDASGTISILDARSGALRGAYPVNESPAALDPLHNRLYFDEAGTVRALSLDHGMSVATGAGAEPLAVASSRGLIALSRTTGGSPFLLLASTRTLAPLARVPLRVRGETISTLAFSPDNSRLMVGLRSGWLPIDLRGCKAQ